MKRVGLEERFDSFQNKKNEASDNHNDESKCEVIIGYQV
jgi:hypothetical protein